MEAEGQLKLSRVRLKLSGILAFSGNIVNILLGYAFTVVVARRLTPVEFGIWGIIVYFATYPLWISRIPRYWGLRFSARGFTAAPATTVFLSFTLGLLLAGVFSVIGLVTASSLGVDPTPFLLYSAAVLLLSMSRCLEALLQAVRTHFYWLATITFSSIRVAVVCALLLGIYLGITGPVVATILAVLSECLVILYLLRGYLRWHLDFKLALRWLKAAWIPLYHTSSSFLRNLYALAIVLATGSPLPIAYFNAVSSLGRSMSLGATLGIGLYPKMLRGGSAKDVEETLKLLLLFAIPITAGCIATAPFLLAMLRVEYVAATLAFQLFMLGIFLMAINRVLSFILLGSERIDLSEHYSFRQLLKSKLFTTPTTFIAPSVIGVLSVYLLALHMEDPILVVTTWSAIYTAAFLFSVCIRWVMARRMVPFSMPWRNVSAYLGAAAIMVAVLTLAMQRLEITRSFAACLVNLLLLVILGSAIYFTIVYLIDDFFRSLVRQGFKMIKTRLVKVSGDAEA